MYCALSRAIFFVFVEQILHDVDDAHVTMMTRFGEKFGDSIVGFGHQVVHDHQGPWLELVDVR